MRKGALAIPSSTLGGRGDAFLVFDLRHDFKSYSWISDNEENSSIVIQFIRDKLSLSSYSVKMRTDFSYNYPLEWNLEGSNDGFEWELVHHKERNKDLSSPGKVGTYRCSGKRLRIEKMSKKNCVNVDFSYASLHFLHSRLRENKKMIRVMHPLGYT